MQALLERMMPVDYKTLHTVKSLALRIAGGQVRAAGQHRDQTEPHATRARDAACARCKIFFHGGRIEIPSMCQQSLRSVALTTHKKYLPRGAWLRQKSRGGWLCQKSRDEKCLPNP